MLRQPTKQNIAQAATLLQNSELVAFPTETVYGLGANALSEDAVAKIYALKGRPSYNPLIVHVPSWNMAMRYAVLDARARTVAHALWPGPLTLVLPLRADSGLAANALAGLDTVAIRVPAHPVAHELLVAAGVPVAAPSANLSGRLSPTNATHVARQFEDAAPFMLAGGAAKVGIESTILDLTGHLPKILRAGAIGVDELEPLIGAVEFADGTEAIKAPGQLKRHYATNTPLRLNAVDVKAGEAFLGFGNMNFIGAENIGFARDMDTKLWRNLSPEGDLHMAAMNLYAYLDELDQSGATAIAVQSIPPVGLGIAINDRLKRAAVPKGEE